MADVVLHAGIDHFDAVFGAPGAEESSDVPVGTARHDQIDLGEEVRTEVGFGKSVRGKRFRAEIYAKLRAIVWRVKRGHVRIYYSKNVGIFFHFDCAYLKPNLTKASKIE